MNRPDALSLKFRLPAVSRSLQVMAIVLLLLIVAASVQQLVSLRHAIVSDTERQMARLDMVFAEQTGRAVEMVDFIVRNAVETLKSGDPGAPSRAEMDALLRRCISGVRQLAALTVTDLDGNVRYGSDPDVARQIPTEGFESLAWHKSHPDSNLRISPPFRSVGGRWTALLTRLMQGPDGLPSGMVAADLNLAYFEEFYRSVELTENGSIILHLRDGTVLARYPHVDAAIGTTFADLPPFKDVLAKTQAGTLLMESPIDGSIRVTAIRALRSFPLAVMVSVDEGALLAGWRQEAWTLVAAAIGVSFMAVGLLLVLASRSRLIERLLNEANSAHAAAEQANSQLKLEMSERERAEAALSQAQRIEAIGQLTGGVAHDFNNLLTVVLGNVDLLQRRRNGGRPDLNVSERLDAIRSAAERGATLTSHLLAFARRQPLMPRAANLNGIITGMQALLDSALGGRVRLEIRLAPDLWLATVDPTQIELAILNLAINARDATPMIGSVTIETVNVHRDGRGKVDELPLGDYVIVVVRDTGTGMAPDVKARAFEPFFTTKAPGSGSGLGLSQVFGTARQLGGGVHIDTREGYGTAVSVYLPRAMEQEKLSRPVPPFPPERPNGGGATILLVDDDEPVRQVTATTLRELGYAVREAKGGAAALQMLSQGVAIDVLLTDLVMQGMSGTQLADAAMAARADLAVVFVSGDVERAQLAQGGRATRLVGKPFRPEELREQIEAALAERSGRHSASPSRALPLTTVE